MVFANEAVLYSITESSFQNLLEFSPRQQVAGSLDTTLRGFLLVTTIAILLDRVGILFLQSPAAIVCTMGDSSALRVVSRSCRADARSDSGILVSIQWPTMRK